MPYHSRPLLQVPRLAVYLEDAYGSISPRSTIRLFYTQIPALIHLPPPSVRHFERSEQSAGAAAGVDADQMPQVKDVVLRRVAHNGDLARAMRSRQEVLKRKPTECLAVLSFEGQVRLVVGVNEEVRVRLDERQTAFE